MEFLPLNEFDSLTFDTQNVYVQEEAINPPKLNLSMIKEKENVITVIIKHNQNAPLKGKQMKKESTQELNLY